MKKINFLFLILVGFGFMPNYVNAQKSTFFTSYPTLSPDAQTIYFSYEGDIWKVPTLGGQALRVTAMPGDEILPRVSPDGKWLAFTSNQYGNNDVYIMSILGGEIKQLTYHDATDEVDSWSWDSKSIYFTSNRYNSASSYKVAIEGGTAQRLFDHYFNTTHLVAEAPNGEIFFNDTWESRNFINRKRYKGAYNPDIQSYNPKTKAYKQYTDYLGKDFWTSIDSKGNIYFASDEGNQEYNLYTFTGDKKTALTQFPTSIKRPFVAANGSTVVFEKDYELWTYDVASKKTNKVTIQITQNPILAKDKEFDVRGEISYFDVSLDGKKMAFVSRGELFVSDIDGKFVRKISNTGERIKEVYWLSDSKTLLYNQTVDGYLNLFTISADGKEAARQITNTKMNNRALSLNKSKSAAVYLAGREELKYLNLKTFESKLVLKDEFWGLPNSSVSFSPNEEYILFTAVRNFEKDIFIHHIKDQKTINLTNTGVSENEPIWSPDGKYIYFYGNRTKPSFPTGVNDTRIYRIPLSLFDEPFRSDKFDALFAASPTTDKAEEGKKTPTLESIKIDINRILERVEQIGPSFGSQQLGAVVAKGDKTFVFFHSNHEGTGALYRTILENFENPKTEKVTDFVQGFVEAGGKYFLLQRGTIAKYNIDMNKVDRVDISYKFHRNLKAEFNQMFAETWVGMEENFYDENFHGINWEAMKKKYVAYLPYINNRADLRILLNDMLGELNSSHLGFNSAGPEERLSFTSVSNETGIIFQNEKPFQIDRIVDKSRASLSDANLKKGDILVAVDGQRVNDMIDRDFYFSKPSLAKEMKLTFKRDGKEFDVWMRPQSSGSLRANIYDEWIYANKTKVESLGKGRIAYTYMKNMGGDELQRFMLDMVEQEQNKDAIILDLRYNTGGNVHDDVLKFLSQRPYLQWKYRGGKLSPQSNFGPAAKPIVLLINEQSLSDAEMTAAGFKELKLGKIIGNETYRWIIFTTAGSLVDGSSYRLPAWGCYTLDGKDLEIEGVKPDILVKNSFLNRLNNQDPQLERAISEILKDLK
ncbi:MAG: peptidase S41 [Pedobacter sp.]|nr:MAG: peptidase S41 [Pedobacter sp.]